jgi:sulfatase modifying factor 1
MNDTPRQILCEIITRYGMEVCDDPFRCEGLLKDHCRGEHRRERNVLVLALTENVPAELLSASLHIPVEMVLARLAHRLVEDHALSASAARWAVESWAQALGKIPVATSGVGSVHPGSKVNPVDGAEMLRIPAGEFLMGSISEEIDTLSVDQIRLRQRLACETPQRRVYLDSYYIYKNLVTVSQYRTFCKATGRSMPSGPPWGWKEDHPVVRVSWEGAAAYSIWAGMSLPTEAQWEKAARGTDGRRYPWGNAWDGSKCANSVDTISLQGTVAVGSYPSGASAYGVLDMAGNVYQWCADWYDEKYYQSAPSSNPTGPSTGSERVLRGGSWNNGNGYYFRCAYRYGNAPDFRISYYGFRCVVSADSQFLRRSWSK